MKIKKLLYGFCIGTMSFFLACNEDKGNYDYTDVSSIYTIDSLLSSYSIEAGDTLRLTPYLTLNDSLVSTIDDYSFEWYGYLAADGDKTRHDLGTERTLVLPMVGAWGNVTSGSGNTIVCKATNNVTGVFATSKVSVSVGMDFKWGYLILTKGANSTFDVSAIACSSQPNDISIYSYAQLAAPTAPPFDINCPYKYNFRKNVFSSLGNVDLNANPIALDCTLDAYGPYLGASKTSDGSGDGGYEVILYTDKYSTRLNKLDYGRKYNGEEKPDMYNMNQIVEPWSGALNASGEFTPEAIYPSCYYASAAATWGSSNKTKIYPNGNATSIRFYANGNWYIYYTASPGVYIQEPINRTYDSATGTFSAPYKTPPTIAPHMNTASLLFNEDAKKFMFHGVSASNMTTMLASTPVSDAVDYYMMFKDTDDPCTEVVYMSDYSQRADYVSGDQGGAIAGFAIMKGSKSSEYRCVTFKCNAANMTNTTASGQFRRFYLPAEIQNVKHWAMKNGHLFCVTADNKVYSLLWSGLASEPIADIQAMTPAAPVGKDNYWAQTAADGYKRFEDITSNFITDSYTKISFFKIIDDQNTRYWMIGGYWGLPVGSIAVGTVDPAKPEGENGKLQLFKYYPFDHRLYLYDLYIAPTSDQYTGEKSKFNTWTGIGEVVDVSYKFW